MHETLGLIPSTTITKQNTNTKKDWWLTPVIQVTWEAEIRRIAVQSQSQANSSRDPILEKPITKRAGTSDRTPAL
jgi:hypothetical protein